MRFLGDINPLCWPLTPLFLGFRWCLLCVSKIQLISLLCVFLPPGNGFLKYPSECNICWPPNSTDFQILDPHLNSHPSRSIPHLNLVTWHINSASCWNLFRSYVCFSPTVYLDAKFHSFNTFSLPSPNPVPFMCSISASSEVEAVLTFCLLIPVVWTAIAPNWFNTKHCCKKAHPVYVNIDWI